MQSGEVTIKTPLVQGLLALWIIGVAYILFRIGYKFVTGHVSNPVPEENPRISAGFYEEEPVVETGISE